MSRRDIGIAIGLPEPCTSELQDWRERLGDPNAGSIPPHVTLLPPTSLPAEALPAVEDHLRAVAAAGHSFRIRLRGAGTFRPVSPVVFVPLVEGGADCARLEAGVRSGPLARDVRFPYSPHVTVAHELPDHLLDRAFEVLTPYEACVQVWGFSLFEKGRDRIWRPQRDYPFGASVPGPVRAPERIAG